MPSDFLFFRYDSDGIATHDQQTLPAVAATSLTELKDKAKDFSVIGIDEGQFVSTRLYNSIPYS